MSQVEGELFEEMILQDCITMSFENSGKLFPEQQATQGTIRTCHSEHVGSGKEIDSTTRQLIHLFFLVYEYFEV